MMMMSLAPTGKNPDDIPTFTSGIKVNGSTASQPEPWQETDSIEEDDDDGIDPQEPDSRNVLNGVLGHVVNQLKQHEDSLLYLISEGANNTSYTAKEYQDYLKDYVVNGIGWEAPEEDKQAYATRAIYKELPNAMAADTTNKTFSAAAKVFLGRPIEIPTGAFVLPAATQAATAPTTVARGTTPHNNPQYGGKIESKVGNATGNGGVQRFVAPKVSVPKPRYELYNPFSAEQQERELIDGLVKGFHRMQNRWYDAQQASSDKVVSWYKANAGALEDPRKVFSPRVETKISKSKEEVLKQTGLDVKNPVLSAVFGSRKVLSEKELVEKLKNMNPSQWRDMQIAGQLNKVLTANEKLGNHRNDAKAVAEGFKIIANANTQNGKLDVKGFRNDLAKFYIDQTFEHAKEPVTWAIGLASKTLHGVGESPLASKLFGFKRSQSYGWNERYVEFNNRNANQAYHLAAFVIAGIDKGRTLGYFQAELLDDVFIVNKPDVHLGKAGAGLGNALRKDTILATRIGEDVYKIIKQ
jgi:hypothetical protein